MPLIEWNDSMSVGVRKLDEQHRSLVAILNDLDTAVVTGQDGERLGDIIERLIQYTRVHFKDEEELLVRTGFPTAAEHGAQHDELLRIALSAQARFRWSTRPQLAAELLAFLQDWVVKHIEGSDRDYIEHFRAHGIE